METQVTETKPDGTSKTYAASAPNSYRIDDYDLPVAIYASNRFKKLGDHVLTSSLTKEQKDEQLKEIVAESIVEARAWAERNEELIQEAEQAGFRGDDIVKYVMTMEPLNEADKEPRAPEVVHVHGDNPHVASTEASIGNGMLQEDWKKGDEEAFKAACSIPPNGPRCEDIAAADDEPSLSFERTRVLAFWIKHQPKASIYELTNSETESLAEIIADDGHIVGKYLFEIQSKG